MMPSAGDSPSSSPRSPGDLAAMGTFASPAARLRSPHPEMHHPAAGASGLPVCRLLDRRRRGGLAGRVTDILEQERQSGTTAAAIDARSHRTPVAVVDPLARRAGRPPIARLDDGLSRSLAGTGRGPEPDGNSLPPRAVLGGGSGEGVSDLVLEGVEDRLLGAVSGVVFGDLDPPLIVLAHSQPTFRPRQPEGPAVQAVPGKLVGGDPHQPFKIHPSPPWPRIARQPFYQDNLREVDGGGTGTHPRSSKANPPDLITSCHEPLCSSRSLKRMRLPNGSMTWTDLLL